MEILLISLLTFAAAFVGTISGFGLSMLMLPVMAIFLPLPIALLFVGIIHFFTDLWKLFLFKKGFDLRLILSFGIPGMLTSFIGAYILLNGPQDFLTKLLGLLLIAYVIFLIFDPEFKLPQNKLTSGVGGILSGIMAGIFGTGGAIRSAVLEAFELRRDVYLFSTGAIGLMIDSSRLITYTLGGVQLPSDFAWGFLVYIPISLIAAELAKKVDDKIPQNKFRIVVSIFLFFVGLRLLTQ